MSDNGSRFHYGVTQALYPGTAPGRFQATLSPEPFAPTAESVVRVHRILCSAMGIPRPF